MPTFVHGKNVRVYVDTYDFSSYFNDFTSAQTVDHDETSTFGTVAKTYVIGIKDGKMTLKGLFEPTVLTGTDQYFAGVRGLVTKQIITISQGGLAVGSRCTLAKTDNTNYEVSGAIGSVVKASAEFAVSGGLDEGDILSDGTAITATAFGASVDDALATTNGGVGHLHIPANTRNGTITVAVQSSANNSVWADLLTFTIVSSATKAIERIEIAGAVARYLRVSYTVAGTTGSATPVVAFARR